MTRPARILQADAERIIRAARKTAPDARVIVDLANQRMEIILSPSDRLTDSAEEEPNPWEQDDGPA